MLFDVFKDPSLLLARVVVLVVAFSVHEFAHAWTANYFGDDTPRMNGRLTLNPLAHLDPIGSLLLLVAGFGWAKPVPVSPYVLQRRAPSALMWVSLAGPLSNFLMAVFAAIPFRLGLVSLYSSNSQPHLIPGASEILWEFLLINLILMLFNLIPISPLDGDKIADYFFPPAWGRVLDNIRPYGPVILILVAFTGLINFIIGPALNVLLRLLLG
ncbi:MAG: site-2 protease family protein [Chloroflexota bacterium]